MSAATATEEVDHALNNGITELNWTDADNNFYLGNPGGNPRDFLEV